MHLPDAIAVLAEPGDVLVGGLERELGRRGLEMDLCGLTKLNRLAVKADQVALRIDDSKTVYGEYRTNQQ